ncbi:SDR family oxidoreductase [Erythrobacter litoralis]|uniref:SDR family oxidoreductase n=1 Tax=Erythrobacter litoralis TaxID=39960 RepID=UPI0024349232|nr:SDR family oxidoreductase [Erythrobacter litoralis]MDG6078459.1 SDR family oxidoreductase [Erythrobacter litoralis]
MDLGIAGRHAVICASSAGLGHGCALHLARAGCSIVLNGRDEEKLEQAAAVLRKEAGAEVTAILGDITERKTREKLLSVKPVDILVNNAGGPPLADFRDLSDEDIHRGLNSNMVTPIMMVQGVIDGMVERGFGRIVNITSASVLTGIPKLDLSSGARAGLTAFLSGVARQVAGSNVTINNLLPGNFDTDRQDAIIANIAKQAGKAEDEVRKARESSGPAGRFGTPDEFGAACAFLASTHAGYITGQNLLMDGGAFTANF